MRRTTLRLCGGLICALALTGTAAAQTTIKISPSASPEEISAALMGALIRPEPSAQEKKDTKLLETAIKDFQRRSYPGLSKHVPDLTRALDNSAGASVSDPDLYLTLGSLLGAYYVELHQNENAVAALDKALKHRPSNPAANGEKGVALASMRRFDEALAAYDAGLAGGEGGPSAQARLHRGRGIVLIDLKRLDDAEAALKESLKLQPNHPIALNELKYIAEIRAGGADDRPIGPPVKTEDAAKLPLN